MTKRIVILFYFILFESKIIFYNIYYALLLTSIHDSPYSGLNYLISIYYSAANFFGNVKLYPYNIPNYY